MRSHALDIIPSAVLGGVSGPDCSSFYLPWWGKALLFLLGTPLGWACAALLVAALIALIVIADRRWGSP